MKKQNQLQILTKLLSIKTLALGLLLTVGISSCKFVSPTEVVLRVDSLGKNAGDIKILKVPGKYPIAGFSATDYEFEITEQNYRWTKDIDDSYGSERDESIKLQIEGNDCTLDLGIRFYIDNTDSTGLKHLVTKYPTSLDGVVDGVLYDLVRGAVKEQFQGKDLDDVMDNLSAYTRGPITDSVIVRASDYAIKVLEVYDISGLNAPTGVMEAKKATQKSAQRIMKAIEDAKQQAILDSTLIKSAKAEAEATRIRNNNQPSSNVLKQQYIDKWNGVQAPGGDVVNLNNL